MTDQTRVVHVGPDVRDRGGIPAVTRELLASSLSRRYRLSFIATYAAEQPLRRSPLRQLRLFPIALARLGRWCSRPGERIVHLHTAVRGSWYRKAACILVVKAAGRPVVLQVHSGAVDLARFWAALPPPARAAIGALFRRVDRVLTVSAAGAEVIRREMGVGEVTVVPNPAPAIAPELARMPEDGRPTRVLFLGGFANPSKGGAVLLEALRRLPPELGFELWLAGPGEPAPEAARRVVARDGVRWLGWLEEPEKLSALRAAHIVVLPSISEGLPIALLEAMAFGRAVVAASVGGIPELLTPGTDGVLVPPGDSDALARALLELASDPPRQRRLGQAARQRVTRLNDVEVTARLSAVYDGLVGGSAATAEPPARRRRSPDEAFLRNRATDAVFLCYHSIAKDGPAWTSVGAETFERQLDVLRRLGYRAGRQADLARLLTGRRPEQPLAFLSFDDGYRDNHTAALPVLQAAGWTGMVFLLPPAVDTGGPFGWPEVANRRQEHPEVMRSLTWSQVEEMAEAGIEFGSHTNTHRLLPQLSDDELREELFESRRRIVDRLGSCAALAYPFGAWSPRVEQAAAAAGFTYGFTLPDRTQRRVSALTIPRIAIDHRDDPRRFALKVREPVRRLWLGPGRPEARRVLRFGARAPHGRQWP